MSLLLSKTITITLTTLLLVSYFLFVVFLIIRASRIHVHTIVVYLLLWNVVCTVHISLVYNNVGSTYIHITIEVICTYYDLHTLGNTVCNVQYATVLEMKDFSSIAAATQFIVPTNSTYVCKQAFDVSNSHFKINFIMH